MTTPQRSTASQPASGWRGVALVAITYIYFLIFAQFAFLRRLAELQIADTHLKAVMAAMALGGVLFSLLTPRILSRLDPSARDARRAPSHASSILQVALAASMAAALLTLLPLNLPASVAVAFLIGASLGTLTVTLVTHLNLWLSSSNPLLQVGLGTGIGYLLCNFPPLFTAAPTTQAVTAAILCLAAVFIASHTEQDFSFAAQAVDLASNPVPPPLSLAKGRGVQAKEPSSSSSSEAPGPAIPFPLILLAFTALIWLDSAAFFIIQSTPALKAGTWLGATHLYLDGALHLAGALLSVYLLRRRGLSATLAAALLVLAAACLLLLDPYRAPFASLFYPIGVSLYSVALVAYPALLSGSITLAQRARRAGLIYAIGGWFGSAMGIGMGQHLGHIPPLFVACAAVLILLPILLRTRRRELIATTALLLLAAGVWAAQRSLTPAPTPLTQIQRGRRVYISEGCINCHSQYVRPSTPDVLLWGPVQTLAQLRAEHPPLIGNRRQGPDLSQIGARRSPLWLRAHFMNPAQISHGSPMPSYAYLFRAQPNGTTPGDDLLAYLESLRPDAAAADAHRAAELAWQPNSATFAAASVARGYQLYLQECATCHAPNGATRVQYRADFGYLPTVFATGPFLHLTPDFTPAQRRPQIAQIVKFGIPMTNMPGHEYLSGQDIASLTLWLEQTIAKPLSTATATATNTSTTKFTPGNGDHHP